MTRKQGYFFKIRRIEDFCRAGICSTLLQLPYRVLLDRSQCGPAKPRPKWSSPRGTFPTLQFSSDCSEISSQLTESLHLNAQKMKPRKGSSGSAAPAQKTRAGLRRTTLGTVQISAVWYLSFLPSSFLTFVQLKQIRKHRFGVIHHQREPRSCVAVLVAAAADIGTGAGCWSLFSHSCYCRVPSVSPCHPPLPLSSLLSSSLLSSLLSLFTVLSSLFSLFLISLSLLCFLLSPVFLFSSPFSSLHCSS